MALQVRRGTNAERLLVTPLQGELIYTTDTRNLYVGDGITLGGILVSGPGSGAFVEEIQDIVGPMFTSGDHTNIAFVYNDETGTIDAIVNVDSFDEDAIKDTVSSMFLEGSHLGINFIYDEEEKTINAEVSDILDTSGIQNIVGNMFISGAHSNIIFDYDIESETINASVIGGLFSVADDNSPVLGGGLDLNGFDIFGINSTITANNFIGDIQGSVFGNDSSTLVDSVNSRITGDLYADVYDTNGSIILNSGNKSLNISEINFGDGGLLFGDSLNITTKEMAILSQNLPSELSSGNLLSVLGAHGDSPSHSFGFARSRGSIFSPSAVQNNDGIITFGIGLHNGSSFLRAGGLSASALVSGGVFTSQWYIDVLNTAGSSTHRTATFNEFNVDFAVPPKVPSYATNAERDSQITAASAGMIIYVVDYDGVGGGPQAQIFEGTTNTWRVINWT